MIRLLGIVVLIAGQVAPQKPEQKFGLWELTDTLTPTGMGASGRTQRLRECMTAESNASLSKLAAPLAAGCAPSNETNVGGVHSYDVNCHNSKIHVETQHLSPEHYRTTSQVQMTTDPQHRTFTHVLDLRFISASCGDIKPGQLQVVP